jgi:hypothetical protein
MLERRIYCLADAIRGRWQCLAPDVRGTHMGHKPAPLDVAVVGLVIDVWRLGTTQVTHHCEADALSAVANLILKETQ